MIYTKQLYALVVFGFYLMSTPFAWAGVSPLSLFPLECYPQQFSAWFTSKDTVSHKPLLTQAQQKKHYRYLMEHYFGTESPWHPAFISKVLKRPNLYDDLFHAQSRNLHESISATLQAYRNEPTKKEDTIGYGANFRPYHSTWFNQVEHNMALAQFKGDLKYQPSKRAIATENLQGRTLPTDEVYFLHHNLPGQGYPFDLLQASTLWAGTPLYILGETRNRAWVLVRSPRFVAWVKRTGVAYVDESFIKQWGQSGRFVAVTRPEVPIIDKRFNLFRFFGHIGMMLPQVQGASKGTLTALIPVRSPSGKAIIETAQLKTHDAAQMPLTPTIAIFQAIMQRSLGRPYGWGGMYFYNDCASELKNIFVPLGMWLPINSINQSDPRQCLGTAQDLSSLNEDERLIALSQSGRPFMTVIYINGHVMLYVGTYTNSAQPTQQVPLTYQTLWGLKPKQQPDRRAIIGKTVLFPLLKSYPEDEQLIGLAAKPAFKLMHLDQLPG